MLRCGSLRAASFGTVRRGQSWLGGSGELRPDKEGLVL